MVVRPFKSFTVAAFSVFILLFSLPALAQEKDGHAETHESADKKGFNASEGIFGHVLNGHEFHFFNISIPLPVIVYSPGKGVSAFMSSKFHHGEDSYKGYFMLTDHSIKKMGLDPQKFSPEDIIAVDANGNYDASVKVYDLSLTRNVVQMLLATILFIWIMLRIAKRYRSGVGVKSAPKGSQSLMEPVITFVRDEVAKPNLGHKYEKYLPFLLTLFFFILINNLFGLIPGAANVTGNIAFTGILGVISFVVI